jgi:hypothetical protein
MRRLATLLTVLLLSAVLGAPSTAAAADEALATGGAGGIYPPGATLDGVTINGLQAGFGVEINPDSSALGQFCAVLIGVSPLGREQYIMIEGEATNGSRSAPNMAVLSGMASVDMGDGVPPTPGIPFIVTVTTDANGQGTLGLVLGLTTLPSAVVNAGSMTIE